ncbi:cytochrome c oxidase subunit 6B [Diaphorina citri]|uniref:Cytochrome c oxidase subunit 6B n=1 Tax=Diaphorina citri TaxID=121845 RepID=A0A1S3D8T0_DIACI|nr:cytochrome c oxidase subunit 6B [Diaphorina citri]KAI5712484.1 hypothetical protein M8J75_008656 [Diaphorina citri]KAI5719435.1 hypothetical protein M8J76_010103 [Diaphorina citri]KAI5719664.1 hypothetical protein M8J76_013124 [Diaphorina citri]KAI5720889.1 hypothetical protein M8J77_012974 [Diaphorina citri]
MSETNGVELQPGEFIRDGMICKPLEEHKQLSTCLPDPRFQQVNITNWCWTMFVDHKRCSNLLGEGRADCAIFKKCYESICPNAWVEQWEDQIENNIFPRDLTRPQC